MPAKDSRILEIKSVLCERVQGRILGVCNRSTREAIALFSPKQAKRSAIADVSLVKPNPPKSLNPYKIARCFSTIKIGL